jgi:ABC-type amino acid transport substrate-binding protein
MCISSVLAQSGPADGSALRTCLLANNPPYSSQQDENGFDFDTAKAVAEAMGRLFVPVWVKNDTQITEIDETDLPLHSLSGGECDVIFSVPGEEALKEAPKLAIGAAYYGAGFELIGPLENGPESLDSVGDKPIAVQAQTIANFMLSARKIETFTVFSLEDGLEAVGKGKAGAALLWGPKAGWHLQTHPDLALKVVAVDPPTVVRWNESAATRQDDTELRQAIDAALSKLEEAGRLKTLLEKYGIPAHRPFDTTYSFAAMQQLMFHSLSNRQQ